MSLHTFSTPWVVSKGQNIFTESSHFVYQVKGNGTLNIMQAHNLSLHTSSIPRWAQKVETFFSESSHAAYQIKGNGAESTMQAHILSLRALYPLGWGQKAKHIFLLKVVMLHIKLKGMGHWAACKHINCPYTHTQPLRWSQKVNSQARKIKFLLSGLS